VAGFSYVFDTTCNITFLKTVSGVLCGRNGHQATQKVSIFYDSSIFKTAFLVMFQSLIFEGPSAALKMQSELHILLLF
jgi:hypothetical protein